MIILLIKKITVSKLTNFLGTIETLKFKISISLVNINCYGIIKFN